MIKITKLQKFLMCVFVLLAIGATYKNYKDKHVKSDVIYMNTLLEKGTKDDKLHYIFSDFSEDLVEGWENAKITIIEYYSYKCKYCRMFNLIVLPQLRENFINKGIVKIVYRPVYDKQTIFLGGMMNCVYDYNLRKKINEDFFNISKEDLKNIDDYFNRFIDYYDIKDKEEFEKCYTSDRILNKITYNQGKSVELLQLNKGVPVFIIDGKIYRGYMDYNKLEDILNKINLGDKDVSKN